MPIRTALVYCLALLALLGGCTFSRPAAGVYHTVKEGQTLYRIGLIYQVDAQRIARVNGISDPKQLRIGQRLYIPGATSSKEVPSATPPPQPATTAKTAPPAPIPPAKATPPAPTTPSKTHVPPAPTAAKSSPRPTTSTTSGTGTGTARKAQFSWPVPGKVVRHFGQKDGEASRGVQIATARGTPVTAAADGRVTFSGDQIRGYGHLVILKHADAFYTVYGLNDKNLVEVGAQVDKGTRIALSGERLHFEIRKGKEALNPIFYLP
jgi:murein DD-endopeptidase MepM/ murein hydrolase activator NlpD